MCDGVQNGSNKSCDLCLVFVWLASGTRSRLPICGNRLSITDALSTLCAAVQSRIVCSLSDCDGAWDCHVTSLSVSNLTMPRVKSFMKSESNDMDNLLQASSKLLYSTPFANTILFVGSPKSSIFLVRLSRLDCPTRLNGQHRHCRMLCGGVWQKRQSHICFATYVSSTIQRNWPRNNFWITKQKKCF